MNFLKFVTMLLPTFKRSKIEVDIRQLQDLVKKSALPALKKAMDATRNKPLTSPLAQELEPRLRKASGIHSNVMPVLQILYNMYASLLPKLDYISKIVDEEFEPDLARENMTYKQVTIVQFLEYAQFGVEYGLRLTNRLIAAEARFQLNQGDRVDDQLTPAQKQWFKDNEQSFWAVVGLLHIPPMQLRQALEKMPEVIVQPENDDLRRHVSGTAKVDPLGLNFLNVSARVLNPIYHIRLAKAELEAQSYEMLEEEAKVLELRLLELKQAYEERQDPKLAETIQYYEGLLTRRREEYNEQTVRYGL